MSIKQDVKEYYGKVLKGTKDLKTNACECASAPPDYIKDVLKNIHDDVLAKYYGCGLTIPPLVENCTVLDLGCGSGRDCYILMKLVGPKGKVIGLDMTQEQIDTANKYVDHQTKQFGYEKPNIEFRQGYIEDLKTAGIEDESVDIIVSNCVVNLSPDKHAVLSEAFRVLKKGGEFYFSDVYADRRISEELRKDKVLWGECLSGALYWNDFVNLAKKVGFTDPRVVDDVVFSIGNPKIEALLAPITFYSSTFRLWKLDDLEPACEDYGQAVVYKGTIPNHPEEFKLDAHHTIPKGKSFPVCSNTNAMLQKTRFAPHFEFSGDLSKHRGIFAGCGGNMPFASKASASKEENEGCCPTTTTKGCC